MEGMGVETTAVKEAVSVMLGVNEGVIDGVNDGVNVNDGVSVAGWDAVDVIVGVRVLVDEGV